MISKKLVKNGYEQGIIRIIKSPYNDGIACQIGEYWFYFCGTFSTKRNINEYYEEPEDYIKENSNTTIIDDIWSTISSMRKEFKLDEACETEYRYYEAFLNGGIK